MSQTFLGGGGAIGSFLVVRQCVEIVVIIVVIIVIFDVGWVGGRLVAAGGGISGRYHVRHLRAGFEFLNSQK